MVIGDLAAQAARRYPGKKAYVFQGRSLTFAEFNARINALADAFGRMGLGPGQKVAVLSFNSPDMLAVLFASAKAGLIFVPINFRMAPPEIRFVLNDAGVDLFLVEEPFAETVAGIKDKLDAQRILNLEDDLEELVGPAQTGEPPALAEPDDTFAIFYTSGTTGGPKGVVLTHENFLSAIINHVIAYRLGPSDVGFHLMPFYHNMSASMALCQFYVGGTSVIARSLDPDQFWFMVRDEGVTHVTLVFTALNDILKAYKEKGYDRGSFRYFSVGGQTSPQ
jgi:acyl-CoA synthetase (AMP-forming)/AMP-acid ligase II